MTNILQKSPGLVVEEIDEEVLLYRPDTHEAIHLNGSAAVIWKLCDGTRAMHDLIKCLEELYPTAKSDIATEVPQAIDLLLRQGVLEPVSEASR